MEIEQMFGLLVTGFIVFFVLIIVLGQWIIAGKEGRFHIRRFISRGGIDLIKYTPLSRVLSMSRIQWDGKYWVEGKEAIMNGIELEKDTSTTAERYNKAVTGSGRWEGSKRAVLMATQEMFFTFSHEFISMLGKASRFQKLLIKNKDKEDPKQAAIDEQNKKYTEFIAELENIKTEVTKSTDYPTSKFFIDNLLSQVQAGYEGVKIQTIVTSDEISKYLEGVPSRVLREARQEGKVEGSLEMTKPSEAGTSPVVKAVIISAGVIMSFVIAYIVITGQNPVDGIKSVIPG